MVSYGHDQNMDNIFYIFVRWKGPICKTNKISPKYQSL